MAGADAMMSPYGKGGHSWQGTGVQVVVTPRSSVAGQADARAERQSDQRGAAASAVLGALQPAVLSWGPMQALREARSREAELAARAAAAVAESFAAEMTLFHPGLTAHRLECIRSTPLVEETDAMDD